MPGPSSAHDFWETARLATRELARFRRDGVVYVRKEPWGGVNVLCLATTFEGAVENDYDFKYVSYTFKRSTQMAAADAIGICATDWAFFASKRLSLIDRRHLSMSQVRGRVMAEMPCLRPLRDENALKYTNFGPHHALLCVRATEGLASASRGEWVLP